MKIVALDAATLRMEDREWDPVRRFGELALYDRTPYETASIVERAAGAEVVLTNKVPLGAAEFEQLPSLRLVSVLATGYNIIDLDAARKGGVTVCNVPAYSTASTAQHTLALMLELCNRVGAHDRSVRAGDWIRSPDFAYWLADAVPLDGATVGIVGFGRIGRRVAAGAAALGANILASARRRRNAPSEYPFEWADTETIFERADIVSLHCPQTPENFEFVNAELLRRMKPTAFLINAARGTLVNEADLAAALEAGRPAGAAVDVLQREPMAPDCPLFGAPNCIITPHMAWTSRPSRLRLIEETAANVEGFLAGEAPNRVG